MFKKLKKLFSMAKKLAKEQPDILRYEELEPRVLFSADALPGMDIAAADEQVIVEDVTSDIPVEREAAPETVEQTAAETRSELVFVNENVADYEQLIADLQGSDDNRVIEVVILDSDRNGIDQITEILAERSDLAAVHFISHGTDGQISLGDSWLNSATLQQNSDTVAGWGNALSDTGDILFYGSNIGAGISGQSLLDDIAGLTGADVAGSDDATGHDSLGGDWELESQAGRIETATVVNSELRRIWVGNLNAGQIQANYLSTSLAFEANQGQTDGQVDFLARGSGYAVFLTDGDAVLTLNGGDAEPCRAPGSGGGRPSATSQR